MNHAPIPGRRRNPVPITCFLVAAFGASLSATANAQSVTFSSASVSIGNADEAPDYLAVADFNGDGLLDLVSANYGLRWGTPGEPGGWNNSLTLLRNTGDGSFVTDTKVTVGRGPRSVVAADLDADGNADIAVVNETDGTLSLLRNTGSSLTTQATLPVATLPYALLPVDIDGNGTLDLVGTSGGTNSAWVFLNNGGWEFTAAPSLAVGTKPLSVAAPDINGDGHPDLATANSDAHSLTLLLNNGDGSYQLHATIPLGSNARPDFVTSADLNTDGRDDLVAVNWGNATMSVLLNDGSSGFNSRTVSVPPSPSSVVVADLNGDGAPDLACASTGAHQLHISLNDGLGGFTAAGTVATGRIPNVFAGDLNRDGKPDLACPSFQDGTVTILLNQSAFPQPGAAPPLRLTTIGQRVQLSWPSSSPAWSLQESTDLKAASWTPSGHLGWGIVDDGTHKSLTMPRTRLRQFFRLVHP